MTMTELPGRDAVRTPADTPDAPADPHDVPELDDADFARLLKQGALFGTPVLYAIVVGVVSLAAPGNPGLLLAVLWPALFAGWYFGAMVALTVFELRHQRAHPKQQAVPAASARRRLVATGRPAPTH